MVYVQVLESGRHQHKQKTDPGLTLMLANTVHRRASKRRMSNSNYERRDPSRSHGLGHLVRRPSPLHPPLHSYFVGTFLKRAPLPRIWGNEASPHCTKNTRASLARVQQGCFALAGLCTVNALTHWPSRLRYWSIDSQHHHQHGTLATYRSIVRTQYAFQSGCHSSPSRSTRTSPNRRRAELAASPCDSLDCLVLSLPFDVHESISDDRLF